jgi:hypothetical protein
MSWAQAKLHQNGRDFFACVYITLVCATLTIPFSFIPNPNVSLFIYIFSTPTCMNSFFLPFKFWIQWRMAIKGVNFWKNKEISWRPLTILITHSMVEIFHFLTKCLFFKIKITKDSTSSWYNMNELNFKNNLPQGQFHH